MEKYGEKYSGDSKYVELCRRLQSIYRHEKGLSIKPYRGHMYGNYINDGKRTGNNFLADYIHQHALERVDKRYKKPYEMIQEERLFNNLLSSQPMAFNLFCPLRKLLSEDPASATRAIQAALPYYDIHRVINVTLEFIPKDYKNITGDKSAMDAIIRFFNTDNKECFIAVETKYSESLGQNEAKDEATKCQERDIAVSLGVFTKDAEERIASGKIPLTQIYRNFLLSEAYGRKEGLESYSIILAPSIHPSTSDEVASLYNELKEAHRDKLREVHLEDFVDALIDTSPEEYSRLFRDFRARYLDFEKAKLTLSDK